MSNTVLTLAFRTVNDLTAVLSEHLQWNGNQFFLLSKL